MNMLKIFFMLILAIFAGSAFASQTTDTEALKISADNWESDRQTGIIVFKGKVQMDQGQIHLRASKVDVYRDTAQKISKIKALGHPAYYWNDDQSKDKLQAQAEEIIYYPNTHKIELLGAAKATQNNNVIEGPYIEYDIKTGHLFSKSSEQMRTTIVLYPTTLNHSQGKPKP